MLLVKILMAESQNAIKWLSENKIIFNLKQYKSIFIKKSNQTSKPEQFLTRGVASSVKLPGKHINY